MKRKLNLCLSIILATCMSITALTPTAFAAIPDTEQSGITQVEVLPEVTKELEQLIPETADPIDETEDETAQSEEATDEEVSADNDSSELSDDELKKKTEEELEENMEEILPQTAPDSPVVTGQSLAIYYLDSNSGDDDSDGLTPDTAWKSLDKINNQVLEPGDKVLFKAGCVFEGAFAPKGSGSESSPIIIDMYSGDKVGIDTGTRPHIKGEGLTKDLIDGQSISYALWIKNQSYLQINNLELSNQGAQRQLSVGVCVEAIDYGIMSGIHLNNLNVHDVNGTMLEKTAPNGGIYFVVTDAGLDTRFDDISVENCTVKNVSRTGISVGFTQSTSKWDGHGGKIPQDVLDAYGHTNVAIRNNYVENAGGDAIVPMFSVSPIIEYNISNGASQNTKTTSMYNAGIWPWRCEDALFQFNEVYGTILNGDGQAYDCDFSRGTTYQYNYSHDNEGGFMLICQAETLDSVVRYNISQNDMRCLFLTSNTKNADIYNNTLYIGEGMNTDVVEDHRGVATLKNNIFYNEGNKKAPTWGRNYSYDNNLYFGYTTTPASDTNKVVADPLLVDPGSGETGTMGNSAINTLDGYMPMEGSPAIDAGVDIPDNGGRDYGGNPVGDTPIDLGAFESTVIDVFVRSTAYKVDQRSKIITLDDDVDYAEFLSNLDYSNGGALEIKKDGAVISSGIITDGVTVSVSRDSLSKVYTVKVELIYPDPIISSDAYIVDDINGRIYVEQATDYTEFTANINAEAPIVYIVKNGATTVISGMVEPGFTLEVTSGDQTKIYTVHIVVLKESYNYAIDFVGGVQGPVWYNEYIQGTEKIQFTEWVEAWNCWVALSNRLTAGVEGGMGLIAPSNGAETAFTWVAPKDGVIEISQAHYAYLRRDHQLTGNMGLQISHNEDQIFPAQGEVLVQAQSEVFIRPLYATVKKGDRLSFITSFKGNLSDSSAYLTPTVSYINQPVTVSSDITSFATVTASSTETGYSVAGLTDNNISNKKKAAQWKAAFTADQWLNFDFTEEQNIAQIVFVNAAGESLQSDIKCSFSDGTSVTLSTSEIVSDKGHSAISLDKVKKTSFIKMEFLGATAPPVLGEVRILSQVFLADLTALYEANKDLIESDYTPENWIVFTSALNNAKIIIDNPQATQQDIEAAITRLQFAVDSLQRLYSVQVDKGVANKAKAKAGDTVLLTADAEPQGYTFEKWISDDVTFADSKAKNTSFLMPEQAVSVSAVYSKNPLVSKTITNSEHGVKITGKMSDDIKLKVESKKEEDYPTLKSLLANYDIIKVLAIEEIQGIVEGDILFEFALDKSYNGKQIMVKYQVGNGTVVSEELVCKNGTISIKSQGFAVFALATAKEDSVQVDKTALNSLISKADSYVKAEYTTESWTIFSSALTNAKSVYTDENATQDQVESAVKTLNSAISGLVVKPKVDPPITTKPTPPTSSSKDNNTISQKDKNPVITAKETASYTGGKGLPQPGKTISGDIGAVNGVETLKVASAAPKIDINKDGNPLNPESKAAQKTKYNKEQFNTDWEIALKNRKQNQKAVIISGINYSYLDKEVLDLAQIKAKEAGIKISFQFDERTNTSVTKRIYVTPTDSNKSLLLLNDVNEEQRIQKIFEKHFVNSLTVISNRTKDSEVQTAILLSKETKLESLVLYQYSTDTNTYQKVSPRNLWIDSNNYLHIKLSEGILIVSEGDLKKQR